MFGCSRDVITQLQAAGTTHLEEWQWQKQLRFCE